MSFIERITNEFSFYKQEELYFKRIAIRSNYVYSAAISRIIKDIENDWNNLEIDWFINYCLLNNNLDLVAILGDYDIIISYEQLQYILNTYPDFDLLLASIIRKNNISINEILILSNNVNITNLLIMYTDIKGILSDDIDVSTNSIKTYLTEIRRIPLLSKEETYRYFEKLSTLDKNSEEYSKLVKFIVKSNLRLVADFALNHLHEGVDYLDLIQEGNIGLIKAVEKYDYQRGVSFSYYASFWVNERILHFINSKENFSYAYTINKKKVINFIAKYQEQYYEKPRPEIIANALNMSLNRVQNYLSNIVTEVSLDERYDNGDLKYEACSDENIEEEVVNRMVTLESLNLLSERNRQIIKMIYFEGYSLEEIGKKFNISKERVRQIKESSLEKMGTYLRKKEEDKNIITAQEFLGCTKSILEDIIREQNTLENSLLFEVFGKDLKKEACINSETLIELNIIKDRLQDYINERLKYLKYRIDASDDELEYLYSTAHIASRQHKVLYDCYGESYEQMLQKDVDGETKKNLIIAESNLRKRLTMLRTRKKQS